MMRSNQFTLIVILCIVALCVQTAAVMIRPNVVVDVTSYGSGPAKYDSQSAYPYTFQSPGTETMDGEDQISSCPPPVTSTAVVEESDLTTLVVNLIVLIVLALIRYIEKRYLAKRITQLAHDSQAIDPSTEGTISNIVSKVMKKGL